MAIRVGWPLLVLAVGLAGCMEVPDREMTVARGSALGRAAGFAVGAMAGPAAAGAMLGVAAGALHGAIRADRDEFADIR